MTLTDLFFRIALGVSFFFGICFAILFIAYNILYYRVNKNFKAVKHDQSNTDDFYLAYNLDFSSMGLGNSLFSCSLLV